VIESVIVNEWKAEAARKSKIEDLLEILESRFGPVPTDAKAKIEAAAALDVLRRWITLALKTTSLDEFRQAGGV
jgi:hypothetical protein